MADPIPYKLMGTSKNIFLWCDDDARVRSAVDRHLATPEPIKDWSLRSLKEKLIKIGAKVASHGRYVAFQVAEVAIPRHLLAPA
jgi:hypothetical protein